MLQSKSPSIITINLPLAAIRWPSLFLIAFLAIVGGWFSERWLIGNVVADYAPSAEEGGIDMASLGVRWAPADPFTHWRLASLEEENFSAENLANAVREYELAVILSPHDYRYWMELGHGLDATGDTDGAEKALGRAVELAPAYSDRKSTRLNSSHDQISYAVFCLKKKKNDTQCCTPTYKNPASVAELVSISTPTARGDSVQKPPSTTSTDRCTQGRPPHKGCR